MRLYFELSPNTEPVPFDYQHLLISRFHRWLGENPLHDDVSLYSLSWLSYGKCIDKHLQFDHGAKWFISCYDDKLCKKILKAAIAYPKVFYGMVIQEVIIVETPLFNEHHRFVVATPILVKHFDGQSIKHLTFDDNKSDTILTQTFQTKLKKAGIDDANARIAFDRTYTKPRTKIVSIKGIQNRANLCPVIVQGSRESVALAWNVGVGHSTGSGFGALC